MATSGLPPLEGDIQVDGLFPTTAVQRSPWRLMLGEKQMARLSVCGYRLC